MTALSFYELNILDFFQTLSNPVCDFIAKALGAAAGSGEIFIIISLALALYRPTRKVGFVCLTALAIDFLILNVTIKPLVGRIRPYDLNPFVRLIVPPLHDFSFPSGHTGVAFAFAAAVRPLGKKIHISALAFAAVMGVSRLYLYVHYPTDVLAGAVVGTLSGIIALAIWKKSLTAGKNL